MTITLNLPYLNNEHIKNNIKELFEYTTEELGLKLENNPTYKEMYLESINKIQPFKVPYENDKIKISFFDENLQNGLLNFKMINSEDLYKNEHIYKKNEQEIIQYRIEKSLELIKLLHPSLYSLINDLVGTFLILKKDGFGGGSVSNILGLIWINPQQDWSIIDYAEAIYHEFIHQSIFLDDMINSMFPDPDACAEKDGLVTSTILKIKRPLDRSFHAAGVSIGVMHLYYMLNDLEKSVQHMNDFEITIKEINTKTHLLGEQGLRTLKEFNKFIEQQKFEDITLSLQNQSLITI